MIYGPTNVMRATRVYDVDRKEMLDQVMSLDNGTGEVVCAYKPFQYLNGEVLTYKLKFRSVYAIYAGQPLPCLFHCYGRIEQPTVQ